MSAKNWHAEDEIIHGKAANFRPDCFSMSDCYQQFGAYVDVRCVDSMLVVI